jgi:hypothetical protein
MMIEEFMRGCFDCGYEAAVILTPDGVWRISVYQGPNAYEAPYKAAEAATFEAAFAAFESEPWGPSTKDAIAEAQRLGGWS